MRSTALRLDRDDEAGAPEQSWHLLSSTYATMISGALLLAIAEHVPTYAVLTLVLCGGHALLVGPRGPVYLTRMVAKLLAIAALAFGIWQALYSGVSVSYGLAHFLLLVQLIQLYGPRSLRDLRLIQVAAMFILLVAGMWALNLIYLPMMVLAGVSLLANLIAASMYPPRASSESAGVSARAAPASARVLASALCLPAMVVLSLSIVLFVLLPRLRPPRDLYSIVPENVVAFSDNVSLHDVGQLRQSEEIALRVQFRLADQKEAVPVTPPRILMRGVSLPYYAEGQWYSYVVAQTARIRPPPAGGPYSQVPFADRDIYALTGVPVRTQRIWQRVFVESRPSRVLFVLYRPVELPTFPSSGGMIPPLEQDIVLSGRLDAGRSYEVVSLVPDFSPEDLRRAGTPRLDPRAWFFWNIPEQIRDTLEQAARQALSLFPATTDYDRIMSVQHYLLDSGLFSYTYDLPELTLGDPIESFLTETRRGSCEQFSTALALMLRVWSIPTRLVVGFKQGEYDARTKTYVFRDKHAHAWVEVYFNGLGWVQFDPTPSAEQDAVPAEYSVSALGRFFEHFRNSSMRIYRRLDASWTTNVVGYTRSKQKRIFSGLTGAVSALTARASGILGVQWPAIPHAGLLQVAVLVVLLTFAGMGVYLAARWLSEKVHVPGVGGPGGHPPGFYGDLLRILRRKGIERAVHLTPREFERVAAAQLAQANQEPAALRAALALVTDLYYRARFGAHAVTPEESQQVRRALSLLKGARAVRAGGRAGS